MENESVLTKAQERKFTAEWADENGKHALVAVARHDDRCGNGHNTFSVTGTLYSERGSRRDGTCRMIDGTILYFESGGCIHDEIAKRIPELAPLLKWHLCSTDGPMHYIANTVYLAGNRDYNRSEEHTSELQSR
jgi:hypothetical protein